MKHCYIILLLLFGAINWSCEDTLTMTPEASVTFGNAYQTEKDIESAMFAVESVVRGLASDCVNWSSKLGEFDDYFSNGGGFALLQPAKLNGYTYTWNKAYVILKETNSPLPFLNDVPMSEERRNFYRGQIHFYKAFTYLHLVRNFGDCMLIRDEVVPGPLARTSWVDVVDYAIGEARAAANLLPEYSDLKDADGDAVTYKSFPCKGAANAVLAHLCAWKAGCKYMAPSVKSGYDENALWQAVDSACTAIISRDDIYELAPNPEAVCTSVLAGGDRESIYESIFRGFADEFGDMNPTFLLAEKWQTYPVNTSRLTLSSNYRMLVSSVREMFPTREEGGEEVTDLRRDAYFYKLDSLAHDTLLPLTEGYAFPWKWRYARLETSGTGTGMFRGYDQNNIWFRLADIILLRAESRVRLGNIEGAIDDLNCVRKRANAKPYESAEGDLRYAIFKEREKELLMEGSRWYDVLRNEYYKTELYGGYRSVSQQDILDGCFFLIVNGEANNTLFVQYPFWQKYL